jgi:hypothetical protein
VIFVELKMSFLKSLFYRLSQNNLLRVNQSFIKVVPSRFISFAAKRFNPYGPFYPIQPPLTSVDFNTSSLHVSLIHTLRKL